MNCCSTVYCVVVDSYELKSLQKAAGFVTSECNEV